MPASSASWRRMGRSGAGTLDDSGRSDRCDGPPDRRKTRRRPAHPAYVDNSPGALFIPASGRWFMIPTSVLVTQPLHPDYAVDIREMTPVTEVARGPLILVAHDEV